MSVVIDGNNLLFAARKAEPSGLLIGRSMLCDTIGAWAKRRGVRVHVVFDGPAPTRARAEQIGNPAIQVTFSGAGVSADAIIADLVQQDSAARRMTVVSSDRAVARAAKRRRALHLQSEVFWIGVRRDLDRPQVRKKREPPEKRSGLAPEATEQWLDEFGFS